VVMTRASTAMSPHILSSGHPAPMSASSSGSTQLTSKARRLGAESGCARNDELRSSDGMATVYLAEIKTTASGRYRLGEVSIPLSGLVFG